jgi:hypothetical protein
MTNWISFLSATSIKDSSTVLAPERRRFQWMQGSEPGEDDMMHVWSRRRVISQEQNSNTSANDKLRFRHDRRQRLCVQSAICRLLDNKEALVERWPEESRVLMNRIGQSDYRTPLTSLMDDFGKQQRFNSVWASMIYFLLYCSDESGCLEKIGLHLSEDLQEDLIDIQQALLYDGYPKPGEEGQGLVEENINMFIVNIFSVSNLDTLPRICQSLCRRKRGVLPFHLSCPAINSRNHGRQTVSAQSSSQCSTAMSNRAKSIRLLSLPSRPAPRPCTTCVHSLTSAPC